jgi:serum/glucocorticoid-regulated kinase 2
MNERQLLASLEHSFLCNIVFAFQDRETLFLVMDLVNGGDLRYHLGRVRRFNEI